jgi:hypothetical protein
MSVILKQMTFRIVIATVLDDGVQLDLTVDHGAILADVDGIKLPPGSLVDLRIAMDWLEEQVEFPGHAYERTCNHCGHVDRFALDLADETDACGACGAEANPVMRRVAR